MEQFKVRCLVACRQADGVPTLVPVVVNCTRAQYDYGGHYDAAIDCAAEQRYETNDRTLVIDQQDCPEVAGLPVFADNNYRARVPEVTVP